MMPPEPRLDIPFLVMSICLKAKRYKKQLKAYLNKDCANFNTPTTSMPIAKITYKVSDTGEIYIPKRISGYEIDEVKRILEGNIALPPIREGHDVFIVSNLDKIAKEICQLFESLIGRG